MAHWGTAFQIFRDAAIAVSLMCGVAYAQTAEHVPVAQPPAISPALFVARDADSTIYLFGTVHVRRPGAPWGGADAQAALASADEVWTEMLISPEADAATRALAIELGRAAPGRPLSSWLSAEEYERLSLAAGRVGLPVQMLDGMQPWLASLTLSVAPLLRAGYDPSAGVDRAIDRFGDGAEKTMRGLETPDQQVRFIADLSEPAQREMLLDAIDQAEEGPAMLDNLSIAWEQGDLATLEQLAIGEIRLHYPELYAALFTQRNAAWADLLTRELDDAGVDFVAVGAGHLVGDDSLIAMLRARGVQVERVGGP